MFCIILGKASHFWRSANNAARRATPKRITYSNINNIWIFYYFFIFPLFSIRIRNNKIIRSRAVELIPEPELYYIIIYTIIIPYSIVSEYTYYTLLCYARVNCYSGQMKNLKPCPRRPAVVLQIIHVNIITL